MGPQEVPDDEAKQVPSTPKGKPLLGWDAELVPLGNEVSGAIAICDHRESHSGGIPQAPTNHNMGFMKGIPWFVGDRKWDYQKYQKIISLRGW